MKKRILFVGALLLTLANAHAQQDTQSYMQDAGSLSTLYRGQLPHVYPFKYNGTYYLETRKFSRGDIQYNGKLYQGILLNLDAYANELVVRPSETASAIVLQRSQVAWFTLGGRKFVNLQYLGVKQAPGGYYEVVKDGQEPLLRQKSKFFRTLTNPVETPEMDGNFSPKIVNCFVSQEKYFCIQKGALKNMSASSFKRKLGEVWRGPDFLAEKLSQWHPSQDEQLYGALPAATQAPKGISLPDGFFEPKQAEDTTTVQYAGQALTATYRNKVYTIGQGKSSGKATVSGTVLEAETGLPLPGVVVFDEKTGTYARTGAKGQYKIQLPVGENQLNFNAESKEDLSLKIELLSNGSLDVVMTEKITLLKGAIISAESMRQHRSTSMGVETVSMKTLGKIPSAFGEGDIIKAVLTLPGVKSVGEASGGFNVRGGSADQNLILFGDNTIYNPSHLFGIFSAFNPDMVESVELYKSSIPAEFGGRISSVLSVREKEGNSPKVKGSLGIGLLTSRGSIEIPIGHGKTYIMAGGRIAYSDWMLKLLPKNSAYAGGGAGFGDANIGITHHFDKHNSLHLFGYFATDRFSFSGDSTFRYTNANAALSWRHKSENGASFKLSAGYDHYQSLLGIHSWADGAYDLTTVIRQVFAKARRQRPLGEHHTLTYGADFLTYILDPGTLSPYGERSRVLLTVLDQEKAIEPSLYASDQWNIGEHLSLDGGIRLSSFLALGQQKFYIGPEFRFSAKYSPVKNLSFKTGVNTMNQYIHLISNTAAISPMDTWKLSDANIAPTTGWQGAGGVYWTLLGAGLDLSLEGYYKQSANALDYKSGAILSMNPNLADDLVPVRGRAYGVELMLKKPAGRITGWISYSYSKSQLQEMQDRGLETINGGAWYNAPYDKPHEIKFVGNWAITHRFSLSVNVDYSTGRPITVPNGKYYYDGAWRLSYGERNGYRIPDYFRLDTAFNIDPGHYLKAFAHASITIGVYNVTGRKNPYSVYFRTQGNGQVNGYMLSVFASPIPYINLNLLF